jgi:hypothetical protein
MAIPKFLEDLAIISKLGENPGADNGLSTSAFRAKFDEAGLKIQKYMNEVLIPNLDMIVDISALLNNILDKTLSAPDKAAEAKAVGEALAKKLDSAGGTMTGPLNVAAPTEEANAANKGYVDSKHFFRDVTLTVAGWSADAPYKQTVTAQGITAEDRPIYGVVLSADAATATAEKEAFAKVDDLDTGAGVVTFTCLEDKPEVALNIQMEVNR